MPKVGPCLHRLAATADVLIENFRPGVAARLGIDFATLAEVNPRLVHCSISGFGQTGPYASRGGFDLVAQGMSGLMSVTGTASGEPVKCGVPVTDLGAGMFATYGILAALAARERTGRGQQVDTSLFETGLGLEVWESVEYFHTGNTPQPTGSAHRLGAPYQAFRCSDGFINVGADGARHWPVFCKIIGMPEMADDPRFATNPDRLANLATLWSSSRSERSWSLVRIGWTCSRNRASLLGRSTPFPRPWLTRRRWPGTWWSTSNTRGSARCVRSGRW